MGSNTGTTGCAMTRFTSVFLSYVSQQLWCGVQGAYVTSARAGSGYIQLDLLRVVHECKFIDLYLSVIL